MFKSILWGIVQLLAPAMLLAQSDELSLDKEHAIGCIEAHIANMASWQVGDFLMRINTTSNGDSLNDPRNEDGVNIQERVKGPDSVSLVGEKTTVHRVRFDFGNKRLFVANRSLSRQQLYDSLDNELGKPQEQADDRVIVFDTTKGFGATRVEAALIRRMNPNQIPTPEFALDRHGVPNIKLIGLGNSKSWSGPSYQQRCDLMRNIEELESISHVGKDRYQLFYRHRMNPNNPLTGQRQFIDWDMKQNIPLKFTAYGGYREEDVPYPVGPGLVATARWTLLNETNVPVAARVSTSRFGTVEGRSFLVQEETTIDIHWFSIHQDLPDEYFDESLLHDRKALDELLDTDVFEAAKSEPEQN